MLQFCKSEIGGEVCRIAASDVFAASGKNDVARKARSDVMCSAVAEHIVPSHAKGRCLRIALLRGWDSRVRTYDTGVKVLCVTTTPYPTVRFIIPQREAGVKIFRAHFFISVQNGKNMVYCKKIFPKKGFV